MGDRLSVSGLFTGSLCAGLGAPPGPRRFDDRGSYLPHCRGVAQGTEGGRWRADELVRASVLGQSISKTLNLMCASSC